MKGIKIFLAAFSLIILGLSCSPEEDNFDQVAQYAEDLTAIDTYILNNNITDTLHHWTGIRYKVHEEGDGLRAQIGDRLVVDYKGYFLDDSVFDEGIIGEDQPFLLNSGSMINGWYFMCQEMQEGDSITIFIPSNYAYGRNGAGSIPPNTPLVFDMRMLRVGE